MFWIIFPEEILRVWQRWKSGSVGGSCEKQVKTPESRVTQLSFTCRRHISFEVFESFEEVCCNLADFPWTWTVFKLGLGQFQRFSKFPSQIRRHLSHPDIQKVETHRGFFPGLGLDYHTSKSDETVFCLLTSIWDRYWLKTGWKQFKVNAFGPF